MAVVVRILDCGRPIVGDIPTIKHQLDQSAVSKIHDDTTIGMVDGGVMRLHAEPVPVCPLFGPVLDVR